MTMSCCKWTSISARFDLKIVIKTSFLYKSRIPIRKWSKRQENRIENREKVIIICTKKKNKQFYSNYFCFFQRKFEEEIICFISIFVSFVIERYSIRIPNVWKIQFFISFFQKYYENTKFKQQKKKEEKFGFFLLF